MTTANVPEFKLEEVPAELVFTIEHAFNASAAELNSSAQDGAASNDGDPSYLFMRTEFIEEGENTRLKITQGPLPTEFHEPGAAGWKTSFAKLEKVLAD